MDIKQITYFMEIVKNGSFTKAAEELALSQPALTKQIQLLERELQIELFDRSGKKLTVTPAGDLFLQKAVILHDDFRNILNTNFTGKNKRGEFIISTGSTVAAWILPKILFGIRKKFSDISFKVIEGDSIQTRESLLKGEADIGILTSSVDAPGLDKRYFFSDKIAPVIHENHSILFKRNILLNDLNQIPFVMFHPASSIRQTIERKIKNLKKTFHPKIVMELRSVESVIQSIAAGLGMGFLSDLSVAKPLAILTIPELTTERKFYFYYRKSRLAGLEWLIEEMEKKI